MLGVKTRSAYANNLKQVLRQEVQVTHRDPCGFYLQRHLARMGEENAREEGGKSQSDIKTGNTVHSMCCLLHLTLSFQRFLIQREGWSDQSACCDSGFHSCWYVKTIPTF